MKRSFFQECAHCGRKPDAHQCPSCGFVFELIPGGNLFKYSKRPNVQLRPIFPSLPEPPQPEPVPEPVVEPPFIPHGIPFTERFKHVLIIADTGWGKTWLLKTLSYHDIQARSSVVIVDSEGGFAEHTLRLQDRGDVIYLDFTDPVNIPCLSMFDVKITGDEREQERIRKGTLALYLYVFTSFMGMKLTGNQEAMLKFLSELMMKIDGANLQTLKDVLFDSRPFADKISQLRPEARDYFARQWPTREVGEVKQQVMNRLNAIFADSTLSRIFTQSRSKIDLFKAINSGKIIVVNVDRNYLHDATALVGRLFIAMLFQAALRRKDSEEEKYRPAFLYIDEAWRYLDDNIEEMLETVRKRRLGLVLATQQIGHLKRVSETFRNAAFGSAIKFAGKVSDNEDREMIRELGLDPKFYSTGKEQLKQVQDGDKLYESEFYCHIRNKGARKVNISFRDIQNAPEISEEEYQEMRQENRERYCERVRVRGARAQTEADETVLEPDERGQLQPVPGLERDEDSWST